MARSTRTYLVQFPRGATSVPIAVTRVDGLGRALHSEKPHAHGFFGFLYVLKGEGVMSLGGEQFPVAEGHIVMTAPGETHDTRGLRGVVRWAVEFAPDALGAEGSSWLFPRPSQPEWVAFMRGAQQRRASIVVPPANRAEWLRSIEALRVEVEERPRGFREAARAQLKLMLIAAARLVSQPSDPEATSPLVGEVFDYIELQFARKLSLTEVARAVGRSPAHLTTVVREQTGITVQQWIIERRMAEARQRLLGSDENVGVLAERVGYNDATLFIRHFRRMHGVTPNEWRRGKPHASEK